MANKITVTSAGTVANANVTPDTAMYYSNKSKEWAISNRIVDNTDYSSKYYANESKKQADISTAKATEVVESGNTAVTNIESARDNAITDVNTAGATQVTLATEQATIATNKASEVVASGNEALTNIDTAKNNAITSITNQETTSKTSLIDEGVTQVGLIQNEGATQVANVQSTGFYMRDDKLYYINSQGEETEFKSGGSGLEVCDIGMALYIDETKGLRRYLNGQIVDANANTQGFIDKLLKIKETNPDYFTDEDTWQSEKTMNVDGCVYKFVLNYSGANVVSVRLPKYPDYVEVNAGGTLPVVGNGMVLGMTNGKEELRGVAQSGNDYARLALSLNSYGQSLPFKAVLKSFNSSDNQAVGIVTDPATSGIETTLKQTKLKLYYFIQIATGSETENNIINDIALNNPFSLLDYKYSEYELNNISWLKSNGQWNAKALYPAVYDLLLKIHNGTETKAGVSVKLSTDSDITDYDFVLNTTDETFRLPLKTLHSDDTVDSLSLYFYVGETVQNANLIDAGRIGEQVAGLLPNNSNLITNYCSPDWSRKVSKAVDTTYTAETDGLLFARVDGVTSGISIYINDILVASSGICQISKGDTYRFIQSGGTYIYGYFVPMKGVN